MGASHSSLSEVALSPTTLPTNKSNYNKSQNLCKAVRHRLTHWRGKGGRKSNGTQALASSPIAKGKSARDHAKMFRELVSGWTAQQLNCLVAEFEACSALFDLTLAADNSRPTAPTLKDDLSKLMRFNQCTDCVIQISDNYSIEAHSTILKIRSKFFHDLIPSLDFNESTGKLRVPVSDITPSTLNLLLEYFYSGDINTEARSGLGADIELILKLKDDFGCAHTLEYDVFNALNSQIMCDALLVFVPAHRERFTPDPDLISGAQSLNISNNLSDSSTQIDSANSKSDTNLHCEFLCHSSILSARSAFLNSLIQKRLNEIDGKIAGPIRILLDESVIPRQYAPVLLNALYSDQVDLSLVIRNCPVSVDSLSEVQAIASGKCHVSPIDEATEIYQIARFLEFDKLAQGCEDVIVHNINIDVLPSVYNWANETYGSSYVSRHCVNYLCREFSRVAACTILFDLDESLLVQTLKSDFVQASELEILQAVVRWGEHTLFRRLEEREPNILSGTMHSISRKGLRKCEMNDAELKDILQNIMPLVRVDFILPPFHQSLIQALARGLVMCPPRETSGVGGLDASAMPSTSAQVEEAGLDAHWLHPHSGEDLELNRKIRLGKRNARPRLFMPYFNEAKQQLLKRVSEHPELCNDLLPHKPANMGDNLPDALYMGSIESLPHYNTSSSGRSTEEDQWPLPQGHTINMVEERVNTLLSTSTTVSKGLSCRCAYHKKAVLKQIRLRILREMGLPDAFLQIIESPLRYYTKESLTHKNVSSYSTLDSKEITVDIEKGESNRRAVSEPGLNNLLDIDVPNALPDLTHIHAHCKFGNSSEATYL